MESLRSRPFNRCSCSWRAPTLHVSQPAPRARLRTCAQRSRTPVVELLVLLEARLGSSEEDQHAMVEQLWSMQYAVPGVITASGGPLSYPSPPVPLGELSRRQGTSTGQTQQAGQTTSSHGSPADGFTHCVHFRFGKTSQAEAFLQQPAVKGMLTVAPPAAAPSIPSDDIAPSNDPICVRTSVLAFQGSVESDMEALFRRGPDFEQGHELVLLLRSTYPCAAVTAGQQAGRWPGVTDGPGGSGAAAAGRQPGAGVTQGQPAVVRVVTAEAGLAADGDEEAQQAHSTAIQEFANELGQLAQSSVAGAVQVSQGRAFAVLPPAGEAAGGGAGGAQELSALLQQAGLEGARWRNPALLRGDCHVFMARFPSREQLQAFRAAAPCVALWQQRMQLEREQLGKVPPLLPLCAEGELLVSINAIQGPR